MQLIEGHGQRKRKGGVVRRAAAMFVRREMDHTPLVSKISLGFGFGFLGGLALQILSSKQNILSRTRRFR